MSSLGMISTLGAPAGAFTSSRDGAARKAFGAVAANEHQ
jgi:hypothetical protein